MKKQLFIVSVVLAILMIASPVITLAQDMKKVDINSATLEELQALSGIGPATAQAIIDGRPYKTIDDLLKLKGISESKLAKIRDLIEIKKLNVNFATLEELQTLPEIGPAIGRAIIDGRPYKTIDDLLNVKGIGEKKLAKFRDMITTKININFATLEELQTLPGIGAEAAKRIIDGRPYKKVKDLLKVKGMGEKKLEKIRDMIEI